MAEKTPITEYVYCTPDALEQDAKTELKYVGDGKTQRNDGQGL